MTTTKRALIGALAASSLVPGVAQAAPAPSVAAVAKATIRAEANLERAQELADSTRASAQDRARKLVQRSRAQLNAAAATTRALVHRAQQTGDAAPAVQATARLTSALDADAQGQVEIAAAADGKLETVAMRALAADARMELKANADLAKLGLREKGEDAASVVRSLATQMAGQAADVATDLRAAASGELSASAQKAADLAVAVDTKANATYSELLSALNTKVEDSVKPAVRQIAQAIVGEATQVKDQVQSSAAAPHAVVLSGSGRVTLAGLADDSNDASAQVALNLGGPSTATAEASASTQSETSGGLRLPNLLG